jgi:hypothetical protein
VTSKPVKVQESTSVKKNVTSGNLEKQSSSWGETAIALEHRLNMLEEKIRILGLKNKIEKKHEGMEKLNVKKETSSKEFIKKFDTLWKSGPKVKYPKPSGQIKYIRDDSKKS